MGILAMMIAIESLCKIHKVTDGMILLCCNGETAIRDAKRTQLRKSYEKHHWDILSSIIQIRDRLRIHTISSYERTSRQRKPVS